MARRPWTPDLFLADGTYCPTSTIERWVMRRRHDTNQSWILLLPYPPPSPPHGDTTSFGSLMIADDMSPVRSEELQAAIVASMNPRTAQSLGNFLHHVAEETSRSGYPSLLAPEDAAELRSLHSLRPFRDRLEGPLTMLRPPRWSSDSGVRFFLLGPDATERAGPDIRVVTGPDLGELQTMLNGTRQAVLHQHERARPRQRSGSRSRWLFVGGGPTMDDVLPPTTASHFGPAHEYVDLLDETRSLHSQIVAAIYLLDRTGSQLRRVAGLNVASGRQLSIDAEKSSTIAFVLEDNRPPRVMNRVLTEPAYHSSICPVWLGRSPDPADFSEIVVPISSTADLARVDMIGALVVQRATRSDNQIFDARDLTFLEQLAYRISLRRANLLFDQTTRALHELTDHNMLASAGGTELDRLGPLWRRLPIDYANARPFIERTVQLVYRYTPCVGIGLALYDITRRELITTTAHGEPVLPAGRWRLEGGHAGTCSLAVYALRHGTGAEITNTRADSACSGFNGEVQGESWGHVRSALALPITVADREIGVIAFSAARPDALVPSRNFMRAATQQICLAVMLAQRAEEHRAFAFASSTAIHAHEILKRVDLLRSHPLDDVAVIGDEIEHLVDTMRSPETPDVGLTTDPFEALQQAVAEVGVEYFVSWDNEPMDLPPLQPIVILAIKQAAVEILKNSKVRLASDGRSRRIQIRTRLEHRGRLPRLIIEVQHCTQEPLSEDILPYLYRAPIEDPPQRGGRRHYGAFTAGYWLRAVGGDVYPWRVETDGVGRHWFGTALDIPILTLAPEGVER